MTGYGAGEAKLQDARVVLEARSLNHRFLEIRVALPSELAVHAIYVEQLCRERLRRGRFSIGVRLHGFTQPAGGLDLTRAKAVFEAFGTLRDQVAPGADVPLALLAGIPDLFGASADLAPELVRESLRSALGQALEALDGMRLLEGEALARDLRGHLGEARRLCAEVAERGPLLIDGCRRRLRERIAALLAEGVFQADPGRLEQEVALAADRTDVSEELARLGSHFDQFDRLLEAAEPVGRTLEFLLQEMAREANTIGSKSQDATIAQRVVELKALLERLREQVQNVE